MKIYWILTGLLISTAATAQTPLIDKQQDLLGRGRLNVGISAGQGYRGTYPTTNVLSPRLQYFLADGWSVAIEGRLLRAGSDYDLTYLGGGLSTRYYFLRGKRFAIFAQAGAVYGQSRYHRYDPSDFLASSKAFPNANWQTDVGLGIHYRLGKRWSVEAVGERSWLPASYLTPSYNRWLVSVGLNYRL